MEYIKRNGDKVEVDGNSVTLVDGRLKKMPIGVNYLNGKIISGYLSSFDREFTDELISVGTGIVLNIVTQIGDIKDAYVLLKEKILNINTEDINEIARIIFEVVDEYYGGVSNIDKHLDYYHDNDDERSKDNRMSDLQGSGAAVCVERAALAQNLLCSLGIKSIYKVSGIMVDGNSEAHNYNLVEYDGHYYIFDTSIPNYINGMVTPLIAEVDRETFNLLSYPFHDKGISVSVNHHSFYKNKDINVVYDSGRKDQLMVPSYGEKKKHL